MKELWKVLTIFLLIFIVLFPFSSYVNAEGNSKSTLSPNKMAGRGGFIASKSVFRINCADLGFRGTGFVHKSGVIITAAHVLGKCPIKKIQIITSSGVITNIKKAVIDGYLDIAILFPSEKVKGPGFSISSNENFDIGSMVSTWGFPFGYNGLKPLLSVGFLSGGEKQKTKENKIISRWVINAAFNSGNSGGPVLNIQDGTVIGVVISKLAPIPKEIEYYINALKNKEVGAKLQGSLPDGRPVNLTDGQVIAKVLYYLRRQTQLALGLAVTLKDLKNFLKNQGINP